MVIVEVVGVHLAAHAKIRVITAQRTDALGKLEADLSHGLERAAAATRGALSWHTGHYSNAPANF